ncbi:MAG: exopolyphosphatase [Thermoanaerobacteraceae bacterium]|nr:exopolyphosphatase [Thermoanaerobacteraceae bacterium]
MRRIGIIDIGSNTIRLIIVDLHDDGSFKLANELKESVRLGRGLNKTNRLKPETMKKALQTIGVFNDFCSIYKVDKIIAVATAAVRNSENGREFINTLKLKTGIEISIISGKKEAWLDYYSVINTMDIKNALLIDIGGGSIEILKVKNRQIKNYISLPHGVVTLTETFLLDDPPKIEGIKKLEEFLGKQINKLDWIKDKDINTLVGIGGTVRTIAKIDRRKKLYPINLIHNYEMYSADIDNILGLVINKTVKELKKIPGLSSERSDIILAGLITVKEILKHTGIRKIKISGNGIREGILYKNILNDDKILVDVCTYSVYNMMKYYNVNEYHAQNVKQLAICLYDNLINLHRCENEYRELLAIASLLHDVGLIVNFYHHNIHSGYIILNNGINGLSHKKILKCALMTIMHEGNGYEKIINEYKSMLTIDELEKIRKMGSILRIAEGLDISELGRVNIISCEVGKTDVLIDLKSNDGIIELEKFSVDKNNDIFHKVFKRNIKVIGRD